MPELPEVETVRRGLAPVLTNAVISRATVYRPDLRFPFPADFARRLTGRRIIAVSRRAKYLLFPLSGGETWLSHLGMTGGYFIDQGADPAPGRHRPAGRVPQHTHLTLAIERPDGRSVQLTYSDARRFGYMDLFSDQIGSSHLEGLGPEPLGNGFEIQYLAAAFTGRRAPVKSALLDQSVVAGIGNIYACEALFRARLSPRRRCSSLVTPRGAPTAGLERLVRAVRAVLAEAIEAGGSTLRDFRDADGELGYFQHRFDVYDRAGEPCLRPACTGIVRRLIQSGRSSFFCPVCQR